MSRRKENKNVKNSRRIKESDFNNYSETHARSRRPRDRYQEYNYNAYEDRYNGWQNIYRPNYGNNYGTYNDMYDGNSDLYRREYNYADPTYSPYYNGLDTGYEEEGPDCRACNKHNRRGGRMYDNSQYLYRYEENYPSFSHIQSSSRNSRYEDDFQCSPRQSYDRKHRENIPPETNQTRTINSPEIYALHHTSGQKGFQYKTHKPIEPISEIFSEDERGSEIYRGSQKRRNVERIKQRPEYSRRRQPDK